MLHFVETLDGNTPGRRHHINGSLGMKTCGLKQFHGSLHGLHHDAFGIVGLEAQFHTTLSGSTDIAHGIGNSARGQCRSGTQMLFICYQCLAHLIEKVDDFGGLFSRGIYWHDKGH